MSDREKSSKCFYTTTANFLPKNRTAICVTGASNLFQLNYILKKAVVKKNIWSRVCTYSHAASLKSGMFLVNSLFIYHFLKTVTFICCNNQKSAQEQE